MSTSTHETLFDVAPLPELRPVANAIDADVIPIGHYEPVTPQQPVPTEPAVAQTEALQQKLDRLQAFKGLLGIFGRLNISENSRSVHATYPAKAAAIAQDRYKNGRTTVAPRDQFDHSHQVSDTNMIVARGYVRRMFMVDDRVAKGEWTYDEAESRTTRLLGHYASQFAGIEQKKARKNELGKVNRRITKAEREAGHTA